MKWIILTGCIILLLPFFIYVISKIQMLGWLNAIKQILEEEKKHDKKTKEK
jgi:hypothetical protein